MALLSHCGLRLSGGVRRCVQSSLGWSSLRWVGVGAVSAGRPDRRRGEDRPWALWRYRS